jgi:hypothetical protein
METLDESLLRSNVAHCEWQSSTRLPDGGAWLLAASVVLGHFLTPEWVMKNAYAVMGKPSPYMRPDSETDADKAKRVDRTMRLAEMLFNFQHVGGFERKTKELLTVDLESAVAELDLKQAYAEG